MVLQSMRPGDGLDAEREVNGQKISWEGITNRRKTISMAAEASSTFYRSHPRGVNQCCRS
jgi:hypothetical protein